MTSRRATALGLIAILLWSSSVAISRRLAETLGPLTAGAAVYLTAGALLSGRWLLRERPSSLLRSLPRPYLFGCGALFVLYILALFLALGSAADRSQALEVGLVNYLWPALTILFSLRILDRRANAWLLPGTLLAVAGVVLVLTPPQSLSWHSFSQNVRGNPLPYGLALFCAVSWALYSNLVRVWARPGRGDALPLFMLATGLTLLALCLAFPEQRAWSLRAGVEVGFLALASGAGYASWEIAMREGDALLVAACAYLTPLLSTLVSCAYLRVLPKASLWVGCLFLVTGSFVSWRSIRETRTHEHART